MADNYTQGTVSPSNLPLQPHHVAALRIIQAWPGEVPPGLEEVADGGEE